MSAMVIDGASEPEGSDNELETSEQAPLNAAGRQQKQNAKFKALLVSPLLPWTDFAFLMERDPI